MQRSTVGTLANTARRHRSVNVRGTLKLTVIRAHRLRVLGLGFCRLGVPPVPSAPWSHVTERRNPTVRRDSASKLVATRVQD